MLGVVCTERKSRKRQRCGMRTVQRNFEVARYTPSMISASSSQLEKPTRAWMLLLLLFAPMMTPHAFTARMSPKVCGHHYRDCHAAQFTLTSTLALTLTRPSSALLMVSDPDRIRRKIQNRNKRPNQAARDASTRLADLESRYDSDSSVKPVFDDYFKAIKAWAKSDARDGAIRSARILERVEGFHGRPGYDHIHPTPECYLVVIQAFGKVQSPSGCYSAEEWLTRLEKRWENRFEENMSDDSIWESQTLVKCYNACLDNWSRWSNPTKKGTGSAQRALALLRRLKDHSDPSISPDNFSYGAVLKSLASTNRKDGAAQAMALIKEMEALYEDDPLGKVQPNVVAYSSLINAIANSGGGQSAALEAEQVLQKMVDLDKSGANRSAKPNAYTYEAVMLAWAKSNTGIQGAKRAEAILDHITRMYKSGRFEVKPLTMCVNAVLEAWNLCNGGAHAAEHAESILRRMNPRKGGNEYIDVMPNIQSLNSVIAAWAYSGAIDAAGRAEGLLTFLNDWNKEFPETEKIRPTVDTYNAIITAHVKSPTVDAARKSEAFLYRLINVGEKEGGEKCLPNAKSFGLVINCWAKSELPNAAERAEQLLDVMEKAYASGNMKAQPNAIVYTSVIDGWARSDYDNAAQRAELIFDRMTINPIPASRDVTPNTAAFNALLNAWANSSSHEAYEKCQALFKVMRKLERANFPNVKTNARSVGALMVATVNKAKLQSSFAAKAEELFENMLELFLDGNEDMMPDGFIFSTLITGWEWSCLEEAPERIVRILQSMEDLYFDRTITTRPAAICYNNAMRYFLARGQPKLAEKLLERMEALFRRGVREVAPDMRAYAAVMNDYAKHREPDSFTRAFALFHRMKAQVAAGNAAAKPNTFVYNSLIATLVKSPEPDGGARAESLLAEMKELFASGDMDVRPDYVTYSSVINVLAWSQGEHAATRALRLLSEMEMARRSGNQGAVPNLLTFNSVLNALSKARTEEAAEKAGELLAWMVELNKSNKAYRNLKPNLNSYTSVIGAWVAARAESSAARAEAILHEIEKLADEGNVELLPDVVAYNKVLVAYANKRNEASAQKTEALLRRMEDLSRKHNPAAKPDFFSYKTTLLAWSQASLGAEKAQHFLDFMEQKYHAGDTDFKPDLLCYRAVLAAWKREGHVDKENVLAKRLAAVYAREKKRE
jgi:hypothetical protein